MGESVDHPDHYGGQDNPYEAIKIIEAIGLDFTLGNCLKYLVRAGKKEGADFLTDLKKARWYLDRRIKQITWAREDARSALDIRRSSWITMTAPKGQSLIDMMANEIKKISANERS